MQLHVAQDMHSFEKAVSWQLGMAKTEMLQNLADAKNVGSRWQTIWTPKDYLCLCKSLH